MKKFRFGLRPVSVIRAHRENRAKEVFSQSVRAYVRAEEDLAGVRQRIAAFGATIFTSRKERFEASEHAICLAGYRRECAAEPERWQTDFVDARKTGSSLCPSPTCPVLTKRSAAMAVQGDRASPNFLGPSVRHDDAELPRRVRVTSVRRAGERPRGGREQAQAENGASMRVDAARRRQHGGFSAHSDLS